MSVAKDGESSIWGTTSGKRIRALKWDGTEGPVKYLHKRCRFAIGEGTSAVASPRLFMLANPVSRVGKLTSYLQLWDPTEGSLKKVRRNKELLIFFYILISCLLFQNCSFSESVSALAVSSDGRFVAVGTMFSGSVSIHIAFSLQVSRKMINWTGLWWIDCQSNETFLTNISDLLFKIHNNKNSRCSMMWANKTKTDTRDEKVAFILFCRVVKRMPSNQAIAGSSPDSLQIFDHWPAIIWSLHKFTHTSTHTHEHSMTKTGYSSRRPIKKKKKKNWRRKEVLLKY